MCMFTYLRDNSNPAENEYISNFLIRSYRPVWMIRFVGLGMALLGLIFFRMTIAIGVSGSRREENIFLLGLFLCVLLGVILGFFFMAYFFAISLPKQRKRMLDAVNNGSVRISHIAITDYYTTSRGHNAGGSTWVRSFVAEDGNSYQKNYELKGRWGRAPYERGIVYEVLDGEKILDCGVLPVMA